MKNKKLIIVIGVIILAVVIIASTFIGNYNSLVEKEENIEQARSNVQTLLQKRSDKIPNLVATVKGYSEHESETFKAVTEARNAVKGATSVDELQRADEQLTGALNVWVNAVTEAYPELKADKSFTALMDEISSIENEIQYSRTQYNKKATQFNKAVRKFPGSIFASMFGFEKAELFEASEGADKAPEVSF